MSDRLVPSMQNSLLGTGRVIRFDQFEIDVAARQLKRRKKLVRVQDLPFRLLMTLLERPGEVVSREQLRARLWGDTAVEVDDGLHTAVRKLREVLGDSATHSRYIGTVPRQGYCFLAPVSIEETTQAETPDTPEPALAVMPPEPVVLENAPRRFLGKHIWFGAGLVLLLFFGFLLSRNHATIQATSEVVPITSYRGFQNSPTLSPDGSQVGFIWVGESGDNLDLYVQKIDGTGRVRLTRHPAPEESPAWSPVGGTIAFRRQGQLIQIPSEGGQETPITTAAGRGLSWSPDGKLLAFSDGTSPNGSLGIVLILMDTKQRRTLTSPGRAGEEDIFPAFSPDGKSVAFVRRVATATEIYRVPVSGGTPVRVAIPGQPSSGLVWSPDGAYLLFATGRLAPGLLAVSAAARDATTLQRVDIAGFSVSQPSIVAVRGGREIDLAYAHENANSDIWGATIGGATFSPVPLAASLRVDQAPSFSPDGQWLAFSSARSGYEEIWLSRADGSQPRQLTNFQSAVANSPRWSPDGRWIVFDATIGGNADIYMVHPEGGTPVRVTSEPSAEVQANWSHDGSWIYFMSDRSGSKEIWRVPSQAGQAVRMTLHGGFQAIESEDGAYVYYARRQYGPGIWRVPVKGGSETPVIDSAWHNMWVLRGDSLYYFDVTGYMPEVLSIARSIPVRRLDLTTHRTTTVATIDASFARGGPSLEVSRDGKHLAWVSWREHNSELMLIRNLHLGR